MMINPGTPLFTGQALESQQSHSQRLRPESDPLSATQPQPFTLNTQSVQPTQPRVQFGGLRELWDTVFGPITPPTHKGRRRFTGLLLAAPLAAALPTAKVATASPAAAWGNMDPKQDVMWFHAGPNGIVSDRIPNDVIARIEATGPDKFVIRLSNPNKAYRVQYRDFATTDENPKWLTSSMQLQLAGQNRTVSPGILWVPGIDPSGKLAYQPKAYSTRIIESRPDMGTGSKAIAYEISTMDGQALPKGSYFQVGLRPMSVDKNTEAFVMTDPNNSFKQINVPAFTQTLPISSTATSPEPVDLVPIANNLERVKNVELSYLPIDDEDNYYKDERRAAVRVAFMLKDDASATGWMKQFPREGKHWDRADEVTIVRGKPETSDFWGVRGIPGLDTNDMVRYQIRLNAEGSFPPISLIVPTIRENVFKDTSQPDPVKNSGWHDSIREERYYFTPGSTISVKVDDNHSMLIPVASQLNRPWRHYPGESE